ncbi:Autophagy-related protein 2 [Camellia lanceoleosa]|uniref:Autophagy-related protein 2 n=1 Tax=Camellia lanceoleosa TaxID=1840588 RepID=A0ACC0HSI8_9ERIC|nr:Autophagy-related protein 2 [Camellia lanceoleosa]
MFRRAQESDGNRVFNSDAAPSTSSSGYFTFRDMKTFLSVRDFHLNDNSWDAPWKLVLGYYQSKSHPRKSSSKAFKLDLEAKFDMWPVLVRVDYIPCGVDLAAFRCGKYVELVNLVPWKIHKLLRGLPPIRSLVGVGSGATKLDSLPVNSYKEDHRLLKGMQKDNSSL